MPFLIGNPAPVYRTDEDFDEFVASLQSGDVVEVLWTNLPVDAKGGALHTSVERGVLWPPAHTDGLTLGSGVNVLRWGKRQPNVFLASVRIIYRAGTFEGPQNRDRHDWDQLYTRNADGTYSVALINVRRFEMDADPSVIVLANDAPTTKEN